MFAHPVPQDRAALLKAVADAHLALQATLQHGRGSPNVPLVPPTLSELLPPLWGWYHAEFAARPAAWLTQSPPPAALAVREPSPLQASEPASLAPRADFRVRAQPPARSAPLVVSHPRLAPAPARRVSFRRTNSASTLAARNVSPACLPRPQAQPSAPRVPQVRSPRLVSGPARHALWALIRGLVAARAVRAASRALSLP